MVMNRGSTLESEVLCERVCDGGDACGVGLEMFGVILFWQFCATCLEHYSVPCDSVWYVYLLVLC